MQYSGSVFKRILAVFISFLMIVAILPDIRTEAKGEVYYVSATLGNDTYNGLSADKPFRTLAHAVEKMSEGSICYVMGGVYYESLIVSGKKNLTFCAYDMEDKPVITGCIPVTEWTQDTEENIWVADVSQNVYQGDGNIVFQNGILCQESRWPDLTVDSEDDDAHPLLQRENYARVDDRSSTETSLPTIVDEDLAELSNKDLGGAYVWCVPGSAYWSYVCPINSVNGNTITLVNKFDSGYWPASDESKKYGKNIYYIFDSKELLSVNGEWYKDKNAGKLYMYSDTGSPENVEFRAREYAVKITNSKGIVLDGINARGGLVSLENNTSDCVISGATLETLDYRMPRKTTSAQSWRPGAYGVVINGTNNQLSGCEIKNMYGEGVTLLGRRNKVLNNYIHDINFEATYSDGVYIEGEEHLVSHNTIAHLGRSAIGTENSGFHRCIISYNDISDGVRLTQDGGLIYLSNQDFENTEFHHNFLHDNTNNEGLQNGLHLDGFTTGMVIYRNLIYGMENSSGEIYRNSVCISPQSLANVFFNNTIINVSMMGGGKTEDYSDTVFMNNLFANDFLHKWDAEEEVIAKNNVVSDNCFNSDYTLSGDAEDVIDCGIVIPGVTNSYKGTAPDCGAFEYGDKKWDAGHNFANKDYENESFALNMEIPFRNLINNGSFEENLDASENWSSSGEIGFLNIGAWESWATMTKSGARSLKLGENSEVVQTVTGLKPNTAYEIGGYAYLLGDSWSASNGLLSKSEALNVGNSTTGFVNGESNHFMCYEIDFGSKGYNQLQFGFLFGTDVDRKSDKVRTVEVRDGSADGELLADFTITKNEIFGDTHSWLWKTLDFGKTMTGKHTLYISFKGDFYSMQFNKNFYFDSSDSNDTVTMRVVSDSGITEEYIFDGRFLPERICKVTVTTGIQGTITVSLKKSSGLLYGYADEIRMREAFCKNGVSEASSFLLENFTVADENDERIYGIKKGKLHKVFGKVKNQSVNNDVLTATLTAFNGNGTVADGQNVNDSYIREFFTDSLSEYDNDKTKKCLGGGSLTLKEDSITGAETYNIENGILKVTPGIQTTSPSDASMTFDAGKDLVLDGKVEVSFSLKWAADDSFSRNVYLENTPFVQLFDKNGSSIDLLGLSGTFAYFGSDLNAYRCSLDSCTERYNHYVKNYSMNMISNPRGIDAPCNYKLCIDFDNGIVTAKTKNTDGKWEYFYGRGATKNNIDHPVTWSLGNVENLSKLVFNFPKGAGENGESPYIEFDDFEIRKVSDFSDAGKQTIACVIGSGLTEEISLSAVAPLDDGAYFILSLEDSSGNITRYVISDSALESSYAESASVFVKDFSVRDASGKLLVNPSKGEFNFIEVFLKNNGKENVPMTGILAIYNDGLISDLIYLDCVVSAEDDHRFYIGTVLPEGNNISAKIFTWKKSADLQPLIKANLFTCE